MKWIVSLIKKVFSEKRTPKYLSGKKIVLRLRSSKIDGLDRGAVPRISTNL